MMATDLWGKSDRYDLSSAREAAILATSKAIPLPRIIGEHQCNERGIVNLSNLLTVASDLWLIVQNDTQ